MPHYRKWAVFSPHHKQDGRCASFQSQIDVSVTVKKKIKTFMQTKPLGKMFEISNCMKCLPLYLMIKYIYTAEKKYKKKR